MAKRNQNIRCSFCGKPQESVHKIVAGPGVYICDECIKVCNNILENDEYYDEEESYTLNEDEKSACISEHGDGGPYFLSETDLPQNVKVGEVYEKINGKYVYNDEVTKELNSITR